MSYQENELDDRCKEFLEEILDEFGRIYLRVRNSSIGDSEKGRILNSLDRLRQKINNKIEDNA